MENDDVGSTATIDWARKSWAALLVAALHVVFAALLFSGRVVSVPTQVDAVEVRFLTDAPAPEREWSPPAVSAELQVETPLLVPVPEVSVAAAPVQSVRAAVAPPVFTPPAAVDPGPKLVSEIEYAKEPVSRYPSVSKRLREQGTVVLRVLVDETGHASQVNVYESSGYPRLDAAACEAVRNALFKPYMYEGQPRAALVLVPIEFSLKA